MEDMDEKYLARIREFIEENEKILVVYENKRKKRILVFIITALFIIFGTISFTILFDGLLLFLSELVFCFVCLFAENKILQNINKE